MIYLKYISIFIVYIDYSTMTIMSKKSFRDILYIMYAWGCSILQSSRYRAGPYIFLETDTCPRTYDAHYWKTDRYRVHTLRTVWPDHDVRGVYYISLDYDSNAYYPPRGHRENGTDCAFRFFNHFFHDPTTALNAHEIVCVVL